MRVINIQVVCHSVGRLGIKHQVTCLVCHFVIISEKGRGGTDVNKLFSHVGAAVTKWVTVLLDRWKLCSGDVELLLQLMFV